MESNNGEKLEKRKETEISGPFGLKIKFRGYDLVTVITVVSLALIAYFLVDHKSVSATNQEKVVEQLSKQEEALVTMIYVLTLPQEARDKLKLDMPESLRKKLRARE